MVASYLGTLGGEGHEEVGRVAGSARAFGSPPGPLDTTERDAGRRRQRKTPTGINPTIPAVAIVRHWREATFVAMKSA
jgi:hypothetical protein